MRRARSFAIAVGSLGATAPLLAPGCSLGLNAALIDAGAVDTGMPQGDDGPAEAAVDANAPDVAADAPVTMTCTTNANCSSLTSGCKVGTCVAGACTAVVCPTAAACQGSSCEPTTSTCSASTTYAFHSTAVTIAAGPVGCGGNPAACVAAAYPFVFVGTANGVVAYAMNDPSNSSPPSVPVNGVPFFPTAMMAVGRTVYFLGSVLGLGPTTYRLAIASIVVPTDPLTPSLEATTIFTSYPEPALTAEMPSPPGSLYLRDDDPTRFYPMALLTPPLVDGATVAFDPSPGVPTGGAPVAASGSRVVIARWANDTGGQETWFSLETAAATGNAQNGGESSVVSSFGQSISQSTFAQGDDGSVIWNTGQPGADDAGDLIESVRLAWILPNATATTFTGSTAVDVEPYTTSPVPEGTTVAGPVAWVDSSTAIVLAAAAGNVATATSVQVAINSPTPGIVQSRRYVVDVALGAIGVVASGGFGYVLANDATTTCTLHVFAPTCAE